MLYFWGEGAHVERVEDTSMYKVVKVLSDAPVLVGTTVYAKHLDPVCDEEFTLNQRVQSKLGSFVGVVTGFEYATNRVICRGLVTTGRNRFAYAIGEIEAIAIESISFVEGKWYVINGEHLMMAVVELFNPGHVMLTTVDGAVVFRNVPATGSINLYSAFHKIHKVEER